MSKRGNNLHILAKSHDVVVGLQLVERRCLARKAGQSRRSYNSEEPLRYTARILCPWEPTLRRLTLLDSFDTRARTFTTHRPPACLRTEREYPAVCTALFYHRAARVAGKVKQSVASVRPSVCLFPLYLLN